MYLSKSLVLSFCSAVTAKQLQQAQKYVRKTIRNRSWSAYLLSSHYPGSVQNGFFVLNLFALQLVKIVENSRDQSLGLGRMQFWKNTINSIYKSQKPSAEPISIALYHCCHNYPITKGYLDRIINVRSQQISNRSLKSTEQMFNMSEESSSTQLALNMELLNIQIDNQPLREIIDYLGRCIGICEYLRRVPNALRHHHYLLPQDILASHNLRIGRIWDRVHGKPAEQFYDAVLEIASHARRSLHRAIEIHKQNKTTLTPLCHVALLKGVQMELYLQDLQKCNFNLFVSSVNTINPLKLSYRLHKANRNRNFYTNQ